jgi:O-antigen/teichoic acid export membrane protein
MARMLHGTGAGAVAYGLGIASNLLLLPLYLRFWSVAVYGEWMALYSVVNYIGSLDFGVTAAAVNAATMAFAGNDWPTFKRVQGTAWAASLAMAGFGAAAVALLSMFYFHADRWLGLKVMGHAETRLVFCGLAISLLAGIPGRQLIAVYTATGQFTKYQWLYNTYALITFAATALTLSMGAGPATLAAVIAGTTLATICFSLWLLHRNEAHLYPRLRDADWHIARTLAAPTGQFGVSMLASALTVQGPIVVLSRMLGGPAVALFTTTRTVSNVVRGTLTLLRAPLRPEFSAASAQPGKDALPRLFRIAVGLDSFVAISLTAVLWSGGVWLIRFWSRGRIQPDPMLLHLLLIAFMLEGFLQILALAGWATNRFQWVSVGQFVTAVVSLILAAAFVARFGPSAIPIGAIVPLIAIMAPLVVRNACKEARLTTRFVVGRLLIPFAILIAFSAALPVWLVSLNIFPSWLSAAISLLVTCSAALFTAGTVFLTRDDRKEVLIRLSLSF